MDWRSIPSLSALRAFEAAARTSSFSAAARELNVTPAAIAQHVRTLEDHFGAGLMVRRGRSMTVTPEGMQLSMALAEGFGTIAAATRDLLNSQNERPLRIAVTPSFAANWLMPRIGGFWAEHPEIELEIIPSMELADLRADGIDVAIRYGRGDWPGVDAHPLVPAGLTVVAAPSHVGDQSPECLTDLTGRTWLLDRTRAEEQLFAESNGIDFSNERVMTFATAQLVREAALAGHGIAIQPEPLVAGEITSGRLIELCRETDSHVAYHILTRPGVISARRDTFVRWLAKDSMALE